MLSQRLPRPASESPAVSLRPRSAAVWRSGLLLAWQIGFGALTCSASVAPAAVIEPNLPQPWHGLQFTNAVERWDEALPLGNGILGALVWGNGQPVRISLDRTDLWDLRPVTEFETPEYRWKTMREWHEAGRTDDLVRLYEAPYNRPAPTKIPAGRIELSLGAHRAFQDTALNLREAVAHQSFTDGARFLTFVHAQRPVGMIRVEGLPEAELDSVVPRLVSPPFAGRVNNPAQGGIGAGDLSQLGYPAARELRGPNWVAFHQTGAEGFHFAVYLAWRLRDGGWEAAWSIRSSLEGKDPLKLARGEVERALRLGFDACRVSHQKWWLSYWQKSTVHVPNRVVERQWFLEQYKFGAASRRGAPPITLQGPWTADDGQLPPWKGDYHHDLNTQLSYWPCYSGNRLEEGLSYLDWLWNTRSNCVAWTRRFFGLPGMNVPMTADLLNRQIGGWRQYTHSSTTAAWLSHHFYLHWKFSADRKFLRDRAYPYLRDASVFIEAVTSERDRSGQRTLPLSASPEIHDNRPQAWFKTITNYDLALIRWLLGATAELADELRLEGEAAHWRKVLSEFPDFARAESGALLVTAGEPLKESHRHFSHLMAIHPLGLIDPGDGPEAARTVRASMADLDRLGPDYWCGYSYSWLGNLAARALDGATAERALEVFSRAFTLRNSFHCNGDQSGKGYSKMTYRPFTLEGNFAMAAGLQEMLLQSHRGRVEIFPAIPSTWNDARFAQLRAQGGLLVSAERQAGSITRLELYSERGGEYRLKSPFSGRELQVRLKPRQRLCATNDQAF